MSTIESTSSALRQLAQAGVAFPGAIASAARRYGLDPDLLAAVAAQETGGPGGNAGANVIGDGGHGHGLFQIDDRWHAFAATSAAMNPAQNAQYAARMLSALIKQYGGNIHRALSAYNAGSPDATGTVTQWGDGSRLGYADSVLRHLQNLRTAGSRQSQTASLPSAHACTALPGADKTLIAEIPGEIAHTNQLQSLAQSAVASPTAGSSTAQFTPISYAQLAGIGSTGHTQHDVSWAGIIDGVDNEENAQ